MDKEEEKELKEITKITGKAITGMLKQLLLDKDLPKVSAKFLKRYFDALKEEGFTEKQAMEIVTRMQFPSMPAKPQ